jgi:hypothetical protein
MCILVYSLTSDSYIISFQRHIFSFLEEQAQAFMPDQLIRYRHWDIDMGTYTIWKNLELVVSTHILLLR